MHTIELGSHSASFTIIVLDRKGELRSCLRRSSSEEDLIEIVSAAESSKQLVVEESHLAR